MTAPPLTAAPRCPMCGAAMHDREACRAGCPWRRNCGLLRCNSCGYEFPDPDRSILARWLRRWWPQTPRAEENR